MFLRQSLQKYDGEWSPDSIAQWIVMNSHHLTGWVTPTGMKSVTLATFMQPGPTLILFTPKNPLVRENDYYDMVFDQTNILVVVLYYFS